MKQCCFKGGFTLIELLVVVLIIGILAAIAIPQYNKAVFNSRVAKGKTRLYSLEQAEEDYLLSHGTYASEWRELVLEDEVCVFNGFCQFEVDKGLKFELLIGNGNKKALEYTIYCIAWPSHQQALDFCSQYGEFRGSNKGADYYAIKTVSATTGVRYYSENRF